MAEPLRSPWDTFLEDQQVPAAPAAPEPANTPYTEIAIGIAAGFLAYRALASKWITEQEPPTLPNLFDLGTRIAARNIGSWMLFVGPAIARAYELGYTQSGTQLSPQVRQQMAEEYTRNLGEYVNEVSAEAMIEGYRAQLAAGWNEKIAWQRSAEGYGLDSRQTRSWIGNQLRAPSSYQKDWITSVARKAVDKLFMVRAERLGANESYHASQVAKSLYWMYAQSSGKLPSDAMKQWSTARDERVCPICAPLDGVAVPLTSQFQVGDARMWAPGAHPRCRCNIYVYYPPVIPETAEPIEESALAKNMPGDPYDRDTEGRFSRKEERKAKPLAFKEPEEAQAIADLVKPAVINPFETAKNPFEQKNPFGVKDPFAAAAKDPFAEVKNPFAAGKDPFEVNPFAENPFVERTGKKRIIKRIIVVAGQPVVREETVDVEDLDFYQDTVYLSGNKFMTDYEESSLDDPTIPTLRFLPGEYVNFDLLSIPEPGSQHRRMPLSALGYFNRTQDWKGFRHVIENEVPEWMAWVKNHPRGRSTGIMSDYLNEVIEMQMDSMFSDPKDALNMFSRTELVELAQKAVEMGQDPTTLGYYVHTPTPYYGISNEAIASYLGDEIKRAQPGDPIWDAAYEKFHDLAIQDMSEFEILDRDTTIGEDEIPTVFKLEGWYGAYHNRPQYGGVNQAVLEGEYVIKEVKYLRLSPEERKDEYDNELPFEKVRLVVMRPRSAT